MKVALVIAAAGESTRLGGSHPKQFRLLSGVPLLEWSLRKAACIDKLGTVIAMVPPGWENKVRARLAFGFTSPKSQEFVVLAGGRNRHHSVRIGLEEALRRGCDVALVHDAARPFASVSLFDRVLSGLESGAVAVAPALPVADTIKRVGNASLFTEPREHLRRVQTPQGLSIETVLEAFDRVVIYRSDKQQKASRDGTRERRSSRREAAVSPDSRLLEELPDDVAMAEMAGLDVLLVEGEHLNFKITYEEDWLLAEAIVSKGLVSLDSPGLSPLLSGPGPSVPSVSEATSGIGFDAHRLVTGIPLVLGGVTFPYPKGLEGHSDGDVVSHAVADAVLGAARLGDIGTLYPSSDPKNRGRNSTEFLKEISSMLDEKGLHTFSLDVTIVAEEPKISPHAHKIARSLAEALSLDVSQVSIKATTTDGLGIVGAGEGIAALATAVVVPESPHTSRDPQEGMR